MSDKILVVEDDIDIQKALLIYLKNQGYDVLVASNGLEGLNIINNNEIHLAIVDIMMPIMDGIEMTMKAREKYDFPIIFLSAKSEDIDKITGLNIGADDYVTKPFNPVELQARVRSQLRRYMQLGGGSMTGENQRLTIGGIELDDCKKEVTLDGERVALTPTEYDILKLLMENQGKVYSPTQIYAAVWNDNAYGTENTVAVHIRHLREKL